MTDASHFAPSSELALAHPIHPSSHPPPLPNSNTNPNPNPNANPNVIATTPSAATHNANPNANTKPNPSAAAPPPSALTSPATISEAHPQSHRRPPHTQPPPSQTRAASLAHLMHRTDTHSDDGSQQERNRQPPPLTNLPRLRPPPLADVSRTARNTSVAHHPHNHADTSSLPSNIQQNSFHHHTHNNHQHHHHNPSRKRKQSHAPTDTTTTPAADLSSLTQKPDDHASSVAQPTIAHLSPSSPPRLRHPLHHLPRHHQLHSHHLRPHLRHSLDHADKRHRPDPTIEGSTEMLLPPQTSNIPDHHHQSPVKNRRRSAILKNSRTDLLEENRALRIELEHQKYRVRKLESIRRKLKKNADKKDTLLSKYRSQLVHLFETADEELFHIKSIRNHNSNNNNNNNNEITNDHNMNNKENNLDTLRHSKNPASLASPPCVGLREDHRPSNPRVNGNSKMDGESISNSREEDDDDDDDDDDDEEDAGDDDDAWSVYSAPSASYERATSDDARLRGREHTQYTRMDKGIRKHRRTRAPAWTPQEEERFMEAYAKHGCRWKLFQDSLPGRSRRQIQSHGSYLIRQGKLLKKNSRPWQRRKPVAAGGGAPSSSVKGADVELDDAERTDGD